MGVALALGSCIACERPFYFNPHRVPSTRAITGEREPICESCFARINAKRVTLGLEPFVPLPGAWGALRRGRAVMKRAMIAEIEKRAVELHDRIAGMPPELQSAVIAHLLATWIAGHRSDEKEKLAEFREQLLQQHLALVRDLIPFEDRRLDEL